MCTSPLVDTMSAMTIVCALTGHIFTFCTLCPRHFSWSVCMASSCWPSASQPQLAVFSRAHPSSFLPFHSGPMPGCLLLKMHHHWNLGYHIIYLLPAWALWWNEHCEKGQLVCLELHLCGLSTWSSTWLLAGRCTLIIVASVYQSMYFGKELVVKLDIHMWVYI